MRAVEISLCTRHWCLGNDLARNQKVKNIMVYKQSKTVYKDKLIMRSSNVEKIQSLNHIRITTNFCSTITLFPRFDGGLNMLKAFLALHLRRDVVESFGYCPSNLSVLVLAFVRVK